MPFSNEYSVELNTLGENIKRIRLRKGITQKALAEICDFETPNMRRIEAGKTNPTVKTLIKISVALEVDIRSLFKNVSAPKRGDLK